MELEGRIVNAELGETDGFEYGTIAVETSEGVTRIRVTRDTEGRVPPDGSIVRITYKGDALLIAERIDVLTIGEGRAMITEPPGGGGFAKIEWPVACVACGGGGELTKYSYLHTQSQSVYLGYTRQTATHRLVAEGYLCPECLRKTEEKLRNPERITLALLIVGLIMAFVFPFFPSLVPFISWVPAYNLYFPSITAIIIYVAMAGVPGFLYYAFSERKKCPIREHVQVYLAVLSDVEVPSWKVVIKNPEYRERFAVLNGSEAVASGAGVAWFKRHYGNFCITLCCAGVVFPILAVLIVKLITG